MRNDPCPCGSGKKFKKCHGSVVPIALQQAGDTRREEFRRATLAKDADMRLHDVLLGWSDRALSPDWMEKALAAYLGTDGELDDEDDVTMYEENVWLSWCLHHFPFENGRTIAERFLAEPEKTRRVPLTALDRSVLEAHHRAPLSLWRIVRIEHGIGSELEDLLSSTRVFAYDAASTEGLEPNLVVLAYVLAVDGVHFFGGIHQQPLPPWQGESLRTKAVEYLGPAPERADLEALAVWQASLCALYGDTVAEMQEHAVPSMLTTSEGHALEPTVDRFDLRRTLPTIRKVLREIPGMSLSAGADEVERFTLVDPEPTSGHEPASGFGATVLAELILTGEVLLVSSNSVPRADRIRRMLQEALGPRIRHADRTVTPAEEVMAKFHAMAAEREAADAMTPPRAANRDGIYLMPDEQPDPTDIPPEVRAAVSARMAAESRRWIDLQIPALNNHTPRAAVHDPALRPRLVALLDDMAYRSRGLESWQTMDLDLIRRELGLR